MPDDQAAHRFVAAFHEAGHVVVADALGIPWEWAVVPEHGRGRIRFDSQDSGPRGSPGDLSALGWAGVVAEYLVLMHRPGRRLPRPETFWRRASVSDRRNIADDRRAGLHLQRVARILKERWTIVEAIATALEDDGFVSPESDVFLPGPDDMKVEITPKQGQSLAFLHTYTKIHGRAPAEADFQQHFRVTPPSVHQMILTLERRGLVTREPGVARSIRVAAPLKYLPRLE